jgi:hypothetical protein
MPNRHATPKFEIEQLVAIRSLQRLFTGFTGPDADHF